MAARILLRFVQLSIVIGFLVIFKPSACIAQELKMKASQLDKFASEVLRRSGDGRVLSDTKKLRQLFEVREWNFERGAKSANGSLSFVGSYTGLYKQGDAWIVRFEPQRVTMPMKDIPLSDLDRFARKDIERIKSFAATLKENLGAVDKGEIDQARVQLTLDVKTSWQGNQYNLQAGEVYPMTRERDISSVWIQVEGAEIPVPKSHIKNYVEGESHIVRTPRFQGLGFAAQDVVKALIQNEIDRATNQRRGSKGSRDGRGRTPRPLDTEGETAGLSELVIDTASSPLKLFVVWVRAASGLRIIEVIPDRLGDKIGLRKGDIIASLNGLAVSSSEDFLAIRDGSNKLAITVFRRQPSGRIESLSMPEVLVRDGRPVFAIEVSKTATGGGGFGLDSGGSGPKPDGILGRWLVRSNTRTVGVMEFLVLKESDGLTTTEKAGYRLTKVDSAGEIDILDGEWKMGATTAGEFQLRLKSKAGGDGVYKVDFEKDLSQMQLTPKYGGEKLKLIRR